MKVKRVFVEKRPGFNIEALKLRSDLANFLGVRYPALARLARVRILNRYDAGWTQPTSGDDAQFETIVNTVFSEAQCDDVFYSDAAPAGQGDLCFATEYLGGQYNQRSDSARQCAELVEPGRILIRQALVYILTPGDIPVSDDAFAAVKNYLINPVDSHEARAELPESLIDTYSIPGETPLVHGFISGAASSDNVIRNYGLAMSVQDLDMCRTYFSAAGRDPTLAELKVLDTYWSDHCRHTTFNTVLEKIDIPDGPYGQDLRKAIALYEAARKEVYDADSRAAAHPHSLMDMAVIGAKVLKKRGLADDVDESAEVNACTLKINAEFSGDPEFSGPWLLLFKNETHNHPTEIEPFGGAATCLGGAIRDPLSGRAYVYQSMRVTGGADPRVPLDETLPGKLPQIKIARDASAGFASYGNQIGLATGQVAEFYHPGFLAKRMELGAVIAAVPASAVRREEPVPGDLVILVGGKTGRDGIGGATGSSKIHSGESVGTAGAEVQKGNAVEERKLQRLFRNPKASRLIRRCNDFGAGGVAVAVGELAAGLDIDLDKVPKKYAGLNGVELAISESQERMAVVVSAADAQEFIDEAARENLDALVIAEVTAGGSDSNAVLHMKWQGKTIVELSRNFLDSNGASRSACALLPSGESLAPQRAPTPHSPLPTLLQELQSLRSCSRRGLQERFDGSIGAGSVLFPWGGKTQGTPECGMAALIPSLDRQSRTASLMAFGYDPYVMSKNPYLGAKGSIREALAKIACMGGNPWKARLSLQEYFGRPQAPETWGLPASALLGALEAQLTLGVPAIGGKDSMSGNYRDLNSGTDITVPPTLVAFAAGTIRAERVRSGALSEDSGRNGNVIILFAQKEKTAYNEWDVFKANINALVSLGDTGCVRSAYPVVSGGIAASLALMAFGNNTGVEAKGSVLAADLGSAYQGSMLAEIDGPEFRNNPKVAEILGASGNWTVAATAIPEPFFRITNDNCAGGAGVDAQSPGEIALAQLREAWEQPLATVYPPVSMGIREQEGIRDQGSGIRGGSSGDWGDA
ncbi:MAG: phosphoribosylformylglycinamidine synthase, partial [Treponema sp.]|nr:phosphoribosylformylglycinamidine synthase [Treponema sp.]